ncbi:4a-hydroxytetrahydrobiopterin dehydratase [Microbulbifer taiwanensis]|uniref:4a-hydroxytetrahydrobiopterin dehydratase n=1 Tax=Microbulbifer taiwanensis TaxID=986746 RepID=A0ABW1YPN2_9GAMM|nr:4a-hydroxytetrahydrobiopterin dehydratase [Microbulbifer taiwanensis]
MSPDVAAEIADHWQRAADRLALRLRFASFRDVVAFMGEVAPLADGQNHHPEWRNVYRDLDIELTTHDAGGLSPKDYRLAAAIDTLLESYSVEVRS